MHHFGALKYYRINLAVLVAFAAITQYNYVMNAQVFFSQELFAKVYQGTILSGIIGIWIFSNRHLRSIHLLQGGKEVAVQTYSNFGLTHNRVRIIPVSQLEGNRQIGPKKMSLY